MFEKTQERPKREKMGTVSGATGFGAGDTVANQAAGPSPPGSWPWSGERRAAGRVGTSCPLIRKIAGALDPCDGDPVSPLKVDARLGNREVITRPTTEVFPSIQKRKSKIQNAYVTLSLWSLCRVASSGTRRASGIGALA